MQYGYHSSELIPVAQAAQSLGASMKQINTWIKDGRFPPPVTVDGRSLHSSPVVPLDELNYVAALMAAGKPWKNYVFPRKNKLPVSTNHVFLRKNVGL